MNVFVSLLLLSTALAAKSSWECNATNGVGTSNFKQIVCDGYGGLWKVTNLTLNVFTASISSGIRLVPIGAANSEASHRGLQTVPQMAARVPGALAAINGGYFWRTDLHHFTDDVCWTKSRKDALMNVSMTHPNYGLSDSLLKVNGTLLGSNCDKIGYSAPTVLIINGSKSYIKVLKRAGRVDNAVSNAIGAGPNLVSYSESKSEPFIDIRGYNINRLGHTSNAAVGLIGVPGHFTDIVLVVADGVKAEHQGIRSKQLAYFMLDHLHVAEAMEMDQGGSATLWVDGLGVVNNIKKNPRHVYDALVIQKV